MFIFSIFGILLALERLQVNIKNNVKLFPQLRLIVVPIKKALNCGLFFRGMRFS